MAAALLDAFLVVLVAHKCWLCSSSDVMAFWVTHKTCQLWHPVTLDKRVLIWVHRLCKLSVELGDAKSFLWSIPKQAKPFRGSVPELPGGVLNDIRQWCSAAAAGRGAGRPAQAALARRGTGRARRRRQR